MLRKKGRLVVPKPLKKSTEAERNLRARMRAKTKLGEDKYKRLRDSYIRCQNTEGVSKTLLDGVIIGLIQQNLSNLEVRATLGCGFSRIDRLRKAIKNPLLFKKARIKPAHAINDVDLDNLKQHLQSFDTEDGFPCAHRRPIKYCVKR